MNFELIAKRMCWLAWQACGGPLGMGALQNRPGATEEDVWNNVACAGDYPGTPPWVKPGEVSADYVFGRMMKLRFTYDKDGINLPESKPRGDYQAWCHKYPTYEALFEAAKDSLS